MLIPGFVGRARLAAALQHHFTERGMLHPLDGCSTVAQPGHQPEGQAALRETMYCKFFITIAPLF